MGTSACDELRATFKAKVDEGLVDMKFFFGKTSESTVEDVCADVNRMYAEVGRGNKTLVQSWGDSHR